MRLVDVNLKRARKAAAALKGNLERELAWSVIGQIERLQQEREALRALPVPASFTGILPDTPEAQASRQQLASIYGQDPENVGGGKSWQSKAA